MVHLAHLIVNQWLRIILMVIALFLQVRKNYAASIAWACIRNLTSSPSLELAGVRPLRQISHPQIIDSIYWHRREFTNRTPAAFLPRIKAASPFQLGTAPIPFRYNVDFDLILMSIVSLLRLAQPILRVVHYLIDLGLPIAVMLFIVLRLEGWSFFLVWEGSLLHLLILQNKVGFNSPVLGLVQLRFRPSAQAPSSRRFGLLNTVHAWLSEVLLSTCMIFDMRNRPRRGLFDWSGNLRFHYRLTPPLEYRRLGLVRKLGRCLHFSQLRHSVFYILHRDLTCIHCLAWCLLALSDALILFLN